MRIGARDRLRAARYALPGVIERHWPAPGPRAAAATCKRLNRAGLHSAVGYFQAAGASPDAIVAAYREVAARLDQGACLAVKAPPLGFDAAALGQIAEAAGAAGLSLVFDAHAPRDADPTLEAVMRLLPQFPGTGCALPARWRRSMDDSARLRGTTARLRIVKGEWPDPEGDALDIDAAYLALVSSLAGRAGTVAVATHDPALAEQALSILLAAGTPCELEQLRGLPRRRTVAIARRLGVMMRIYVPFGPGWWPYAIDKALARPYLPGWMLRDLIG